ncbi:YbjN domain-containing protein [Cellulomonas sp. zg-ZUI222]|uniref:YbjN domain-containing protein n=1 Tax=Cellulomonas TaxID=1707 RepID=UPI001A947135|nr:MULTISPECIES: YbjN domain-containing protein [Cellulomonas]MBO0899288.1 YbjN domain-containing protein [Cellulomonas sp. zg-ZUI22]MBO0920139.1 YbjN domain-containing protein [Cellulomonas wangleii]
MALLSDDTSGPTPALAPLGRERVTAVLDARGLEYGIDEDGDVGGYFDGHLFYFFLLGPGDTSLQVRGRWSREVPAARLADVTALVNEWNSTHLWPKGYVRTEDDVLGVYGEHTVDYAHGVADVQVDQHLACGIATTLQLFAQLDEAFPAEAAAARAALQQQQG